MPQGKMNLTDKRAATFFTAGDSDEAKGVMQETFEIVFIKIYFRFSRRKMLERLKSKSKKPG